MPKPVNKSENVEKKAENTKPMKHKVVEVKLKNGVKGLFVDIPDATVMTYEISFRAGDYLSTSEKYETAHLLEHILLGANERFPRGRDFQAEVEKNGAYSNASTGVYDITYEFECADFEWQRVLELAILAITKPLFLESEYKAEVGNVREELIYRSNNHFRHLGLALREQTGLISMTDQERLEKLSNVTLDDIRDHYIKTHTSSNMRFVIAGKLTKSKQETIEKLLNDLPLEKGSGRHELPEEIPKKQKQPLHIPMQEIENIYFYIDTFMRRWMTNEESDALSLANNVLTETLHSRILGAAREQGIVYHVSSSHARWKGGSNWWFAAQVHPDNIKKLFEIIAREVMNAREGRLTKQDIISAKQYALGRYQRSAQTVSGTASGYSSKYFFNDRVEDYYKIPSRIEAVTMDQIISITNEMFDKKIGGFGLLGKVNDKQIAELESVIDPLWSKKMKVKARSL